MIDDRFRQYLFSTVLFFQMRSFSRFICSIRTGKIAKFEKFSVRFVCSILALFEKRSCLFFFRLFRFEMSRKRNNWNLFDVFFFVFVTPTYFGSSIKTADILLCTYKLYGTEPRVNYLLNVHVCVCDFTIKKIYKKCIRNHPQIKRYKNLDVHYEFLEME